MVQASPEVTAFKWNPRVFRRLTSRTQNSSFIQARGAASPLRGSAEDGVAYDAQTAADAQARVDAFIAAHMK